MSFKIYIDGQEGTTGLKILERFENRSDIEILRISDEKRKDPEERKRFINNSDFTFLCLPDAASIEAVSYVENDHVRIIDASTAHRTNPDWDYGFPELSSLHREKIKNSKRVAVPGCYASGFASLIYPMVSNGLMDSEYPVTCHALSGYSGAGKKGIAQYEDKNRNIELDSPRQYALSQEHKHLPEMMKVSGLAYKPIFNPIICDFFSGMVVSVPITTRLLNKKYSALDIHKMFSEHYGNSEVVRVMPFMGEGVIENGFLASNSLSGKNYMEIFVCGNDDRVTLMSRLDNLGKGASGAAVQCLNIMMGIDEKTGLI